MELKNILIVAITCLALAGCDGGGDESKKSGYSGSKFAATVDEENKDELSIAASIGAQKSIESSSAPRALGQRADDPITYLLEKSSEAIIAQRQLRVGSRTYIDLSSSVCNAGGTAGYNYDENNTSGYGTFSITYDNCKYTYEGETTIIDGESTWVTSEDGSFSYTYNLSVSYGADSYSVTGTYACDAELNCSYNNDFSYGGVSYRVADVSVTGNSSTGYNVSAKIYHETYGYVEIIGSNLVQCNDGGFSSGSITVRDSSSTDVLLVTYDSCTQMTITFNNVATIVAQ
ncbi:hypothetical protein [Reinekea sp.]|uniref:hypothetical protein n=2 Tax=Reinekea sp. TaxID=1970455 RepID=UPI003988DFAA